MAEIRFATIVEAGKFVLGVELASYHCTQKHRCTYEGIDKRSGKPVLRQRETLFDRLVLEDAK